MSTDGERHAGPGVSKRERTTNAITELRRLKYYQQGGRCKTCGRPLREGFELAHIIPQRKWCLARWGEGVIQHPDNMHATCPGACNSAAQINPDGLEAERLATAIRAKGAGQ